MSFDDVRKNLLAAIKVAKENSPPPEADVATRVAASMAVLRKKSAPVKARQAAMVDLNAAAFNVIEFAPFHAEFDQLMRELATDKSPTIRTQAIERLALQGDGFAQQLLIDGLDGKRKALVPAEKAAQLLGSDAHNAARPALRRLAENGTGAEKIAAVRALSHDKSSTGLFEAIVTDRAHPLGMREAAAMSLKATSPARFAKIAEKLVLDPKENVDLRTVTLTAIAHTEDVRTRLSKAKFVKAIDDLASATSSESLSTSANQFTALVRNPAIP